VKSLAGNEGFQTRRRNFADEIYFYAPGLKRYQTSEFRSGESPRFVPISITGRDCALQCEHCKGKLLEAMFSPGEDGLFELCRRLAGRGIRGILLSGGSDSQGRVPLLKYIRDIRRIREELSLQVVVHTGLVDRELAQALREAEIDGAMLDIIGAEETIREVCHLEATVEDYRKSLAYLTQWGIPTMPHIVLGLHYGELRGERRALELISRYPVTALVLVVLTPLEGTAMESVPPLEASQIRAFFQESRRLLPETPLLLGCARPGGRQWRLLDRLAIDSGFNGIAYPAEGTVKYARSRGLTPRFYHTCCALLNFARAE
jgi:hypothetical protein